MGWDFGFGTFVLEPSMVDPDVLGFLSLLIHLSIFGKKKKERKNK